MSSYLNCKTVFIIKIMVPFQVVPWLIIHSLWLGPWTIWHMTLKKLKLFIFLIWYLLTLLIDSHALDGWKTVKLFKMIMGAHNAHLWNIWWGIIISWDEFRKLEYFPLHSSQLWMGWRLFLLEKIQLELLTFVLLCKITTLMKSTIRMIFFFLSWKLGNV